MSKKMLEVLKKRRYRILNELLKKCPASLERGAEIMLAGSGTAASTTGCRML
jgi:hypothetical protein